MVSEMYLSTHEAVVGGNVDNGGGEDVRGESLEVVVEGLAKKAEKEYLNGRTDEAYLVLEKAKNLAGERANVHASKLWMWVERKLELWDAMNRCLPRAIAAIKLDGVKGMAQSGPIEWELEASFLEACMLKKSDEVDAAVNCAVSLIEKAKGIGREWLCVPYFLFLADVHLVSLFLVCVLEVIVYLLFLVPQVSRVSPRSFTLDSFYNHTF
jgi:hypothetical protein